MQSHITSSLIKRLESSEKPYEVVDDALKGFLARVQPSGVISYYFTYRAKDGSRRRCSLGKHPGITAIAARKGAEKLAAKVVQGGDPQIEKKDVRARKRKEKIETLGGFLQARYEEWAINHQKRGKETLTLINNHFAQFSDRNLRDITAWDIQKLRSIWNKAGLKATTINRRVTTLKAVINKAVEWGVIDANPLHSIRPLKIDHKARIRYLSQEEERRLREALDEREKELKAGRESGNAWRGKRGYDLFQSLEGHFADYLKPMVILALNTGLRRGEVFNLTWREVDLAGRRLTVEGSGAKSGQTRHVPLNTESMDLLKEWHKQSQGEFVFPSPVTGEKFTNIKNSWGLLRNKAEIHDFRFHDLRHTFASKLVMAGVDLYTVKELMGHSTIQMTERYAHLAPEHKAAAVELLTAKKNLC